MIEVLAFRNVYNTNNTLEFFVLINRHVSVSNVLKCTSRIIAALFHCYAKL